MAARDSQILEKLADLEAKKGTLPAALDFYRKVLRIQSEARSRAEAMTSCPDGETIRKRISSAAPLLEFNDLQIDWVVLRDTFQEVKALFANPSETSDTVNEAIIDASLLKAAARAWFESGQLPAPMGGDGADAFFEFALCAAMRPFLVRHSEALLGMVDQEQWRRGYCPICGGAADFAFLDRERGARWLLCSRCDAQWLFQRLECPACGNRSQSSLAYFTDDCGLYRLYVCERCRHYLKTIDLRRTESEVLLPLERFLTLDLDIQAQKDGYIPRDSDRVESSDHLMPT